MRFREDARRAGFELAAYPIGMQGPDGHALTIDVARRGPSRASRALVVSSGLHGIEGYFGSAVQRTWLAQAPHALVDDVRVVLVHALNPFGFAFHRRVNEENVDLNRNFLCQGEAYEGAHQAYRELDALLNPESAPRRLEPFLLRTLPSLRRHGFKTLKNAVAQGQYAYPRGLFYGGHGPTTTQRLLGEHTAGWLEGAERVVHLDLHSGRGKFGDYALCVDMAPTEPRFRGLARAFGADVVEGFDPNGVLYEVRGGLGRWLEALLPGTQYDCLLAEFGTYNALHVLAALRAENRAHHHAADRPALLRRAKRALFEAFCPRSPRWRRTVVARALGVIDSALADLRR